MTRDDDLTEAEQLQETALRCRQLAEQTCRLADEAEEPYVIAQFLKIAIKLTACATLAEQGKRYQWPKPD